LEICAYYLRDTILDPGRPIIPLNGEGYRQLPMAQWRKDGSRVVVWPKKMATGEYELPPWVKK
jgi:hypothetical protein